MLTIFPLNLHFFTSSHFLAPLVMATSPSNLAIVLCHGSYHTPAPYAPLLDAFKSRGIEAYCPQLPTADLAKLDVGDVNNPDFDREPPKGGYPQGEEDAQVVLEVLKPLVEQGKNVLLLAHSAGGWVATEVARPELQAKSRAETGLSGGIIGIFYMGAFVIPVGESITTFFQPKDGNFVTPPFMTFHVSCKQKHDILYILTLLTLRNLTETRCCWAWHHGRT